MIKNFLLGIQYALSGFSLISTKGIRRFVVVPLLINTLVFSLGIWVAKSQFAVLMAKLLGWLPGWLSWLQWLLWPLFAVLILIAVFYSFTIIANLLASPFNSLLAERVEQHLNGAPVPQFQGYRALLGSVAKTVFSELRKVLYLLKWSPVLLLISIIPMINFIAPFAWAIYGAWMLALQYTDYPMGNHQLFIKQALGLLRRNRAMALGFGGMLTIMMVIPVLNFLVMPVGVAGATSFWVNTLSKE